MSTTLSIHQTHHTLADFDGIFSYLKEHLQGDKLHLFPELFLTGYPLLDLCLQRSFITSYEKHLSAVDQWVKNQNKDQKWRGLLSGLHYEFENPHYPKKIQNVVYEAIPGVGLKRIYTKRLLPNYDIFDEKKYFTPGEGNCFYEFNGTMFGLYVCEDMWASTFHETDPGQLMLEEMKQRNLPVKAIINLSASPYHISKNEKRHRRARIISEMFELPFIYVNRVGGEDEVLFDGASFVQAGSVEAFQMKTFIADIKNFTVEEIKGDYSKKIEAPLNNVWEGLLSPKINTKVSPPTLATWSDENCSSALEALIFGLQEYATKSGMRKFLVALSGGLDSALVLAIIKIGLRPGQSLEAIYMPSIHSASLSTELCEQMCKKINVPLSYLPIKFLHSTVKNTFTNTFSEPFEGLTDENVQSRLRGMLLYTRSNQTGAMVVNTSNKSELAVGYSTQYGDSVGAISLLGDLYKSEVYELSRYINKKYDGLIPSGIIERGPSAELRENQLDQDSLPPYERLDPMLEGILSYGLDKGQLLELGFLEAEVKRTLSLYLKSEYKRAQFCPIIKIKSKSFGFGYRIPMSKNINYHS